MAKTARSRTNLAEQLVETAKERGVRIAVAESLTGGLLVDTLVGIPGASRVVSGGVVAYDTYLKHSLLGVDFTLLREQGPVHGEVARQMAAGVRFACSVPGEDDLEPADIGIATTGVAGPDPDPQTKQSAGTVWLGVSDASGTEAVRLSLKGDRAAIRNETVIAALELVLGRLT
ncbi:CinA family protein [Leucobacter coleopterorum]|uniref:CinA family protein n=1 Tax=Leucobacter coleopterorum TaxID=2714933 RepID=A0ABX6JXX6_9MICO|nr:CinA family protein [Leucobacter coleopterorum]QIM18811.1 CinA family protein [Leucobacter coleopterorum]